VQQSDLKNVHYFTLPVFVFFARSAKNERIIDKSSLSVYVVHKRLSIKFFMKGNVWASWSLHKMADEYNFGLYLSVTSRITQAHLIIQKAVHDATHRFPFLMSDVFCGGCLTNTP
jgi:hypothetical protein